MLDNFMPNLIFSVNVVAPIIIIIALGAFLHARNILSEDMAERFKVIVFNISLPLMLFHDLATSSFKDFFDLRFVLWAVGTTVLSYAIVWLFAGIFMKDKSAMGAFVQGSFRGNFAIIGIALVANVVGGDSGKSSLILAFVIPVYNVLSVVALTLGGKESGGAIRAALLGIARNPLIIAVVLGALVSLSGLRFPAFAYSAMKSLGGLATPLALLSIGATLRFADFTENLKWACIAALFKLVLMPLLFVWLSAYVLNFRGETLVALYVMYSTPAAVSSYIMAKQMKSGEKLAANIVLVTTLLSAVTMTVGIYSLKSLSLI